jgi:hypothetical protein
VSQRSSAMELPSVRWSSTALFDALAEFETYPSVPSLKSLNLALSQQLESGALRFYAQTPDLLGDGLHYEERIAQRGIISTREGCTHDLFNAIVWINHLALKRAMNVRQVADIVRVGPKQRTRGQCALTHFDEAGAIVWIAEPALVDAWNAHDWHALFVTHRGAWGSQIAITVIGHALFDYALEHGEMPVARALVVRADRAEIEARSRAASIPAWTDAERSIAQAIASSRLLMDPQELRPLPLAGIPGWHTGEQSDAFYASAPCFRPLRPGRRYPAPLEFADESRHETAEPAVEHASVG